MKYQVIKKYKYRNSSTEIIQTGIYGHIVTHPYFILKDDGELRIFKGYLWDGVSGPTWDSKNTMLGGMAHDALYQMLRLMLLPSYLKGLIDKLFKKLLLSKGMTKFRAGYYFWAVDTFGGAHCVPGDIRTPGALTA